MSLRDGRLQKPISEGFRGMNSSVGVDKRLFREDIRGSVAYARALRKKGIIGKDEEELIVKGLFEIEEEIEKGSFLFRDEDEDIHMNVERRLHEKIGDAAYKLHTGRSRNEQIVLDERLYLMRVSDEVEKKIVETIRSILKKARKSIDVVIPSYTHLRQAQPVSLAHLFLAYCHALKRGRERLFDYRKRLDRMPLGSGAVAGSSIGIDREFLKTELGFSELTKNSIDAVSTRDFILEFVWICTEVCITLSRMAEDLIIFSSDEFGFFGIPDELSTTSSLMPQKKNPDSLELIRGKSARVTGNLIALLTLLKGLPYTYDRDLQEDKEPLFDTADSTLSVLEVMRGVFHGLEVKKEGIKKRLERSNDLFFATDIADWLVERDMPFREAHRKVGEVVQYAVKEGRALRDIALDEYKRFCPTFDKNIYALFDYERSINRHDVPGGTAFRRIEEQIAALESSEA
ncbi:MAG TPA: argininosuccinate lyase [Spirochaetota bacterium]|nr:argininosuccinate lyase [Spirochaetota bacterium]